MSDLISRQAVKEQACMFFGHEVIFANRIDLIPSADRLIGEWIDDCACSICHWIHEDNNGFSLITKYNFCPNCGARMVREDGKE